MLFFYVRHGDPIYNPDSLTPFGHEQARAVGKMLAHYKIDRIYASTSERAKLTARPLCDLTAKEMTLLDFANEGHAWQGLTCYSEAMGRDTWLFHSPEAKALFHEPELVALGQRWYKHPALSEKGFAGKDYEAGILRIQEGADGLFESLGYKRVSDGKYQVIKHSDERVALFAHQGFGLAFLSCVVGIPYPTFSTHFDICTSGVTVIEFNDVDGYAYPRILELSSSAHLYKEGLPTRFG